MKATGHIMYTSNTCYGQAKSQQLTRWASKALHATNLSDWLILTPPIGRQWV